MDNIFNDVFATPESLAKYNDKAVPKLEVLKVGEQGLTSNVLPFTPRPQLPAELRPGTPESEAGVKEAMKLFEGIKKPAPNLGFPLGPICADGHEDCIY